jgi:Immunity protein 17
MPNWLISLLFVGIGAFTLTASLKNWDWFFTHPRAWLLVKVFGRQGARIFYGLLGVALAVGALVVLIPDPSTIP